MESQSKRYFASAEGSAKIFSSPKDSCWYVIYTENSFYMKHVLTEALVTGGARGLGLDAAYALLEHGVTSVILIDRDNAALDKAVQDLKQLYVDHFILGLSVDVSDPETVQTAVCTVSSAIGSNKSIDILLACAGIINCQSITDHTPD
jgi:sorbose reductase